MRARTWAAVIAVGLVLVEVALYGLWSRVDDNDPPPLLDQQLEIAAWLALLALPHVIAVLGYRGRPWLLKVAGATGLFLTAVSMISFVSLILGLPLLLVPSLFYLRSSRGSGSPPRLGTAAMVMGSLALTAGAVWSLFLTEDPRCTITVRRQGKVVYEQPETCNPTNSGRLGPEIIEWSGTSDHVALHESVPSLLLSAGVVTLCLWSSRQTPENSEPRAEVVVT